MAHSNPKEGQVAAKALADGDTSNDVAAPIDDYPARPYADAITPEHRKVLEDAGQLPKG